MNSMYVSISALLGAVGVILGALGAHGSLHDQLVSANELEHWKTAVDYHLIHAVVLVALSMQTRIKSKMIVYAWLLILLGTLLFSGSLYTLALTGNKWLGVVTPFGGLSLIIGWLSLALSGISRKNA